MTRPEGVYLFALMLAYAVWLHWRGDGPVSRRWLGLFALTFIVPAVPYMVWRLWYFGYFFPNTFYVKSGRGIYQYLGGILYVTAGVRAHGGWIMHLAALVPAVWGGFQERARPFVLALVGWHLYDAYKGTDVLPLFRFFVPVLPITFALGLVALVRACAVAGGWLERRSVQTAVVLAFLTASAVTHSVIAYSSRDRRPQLAEYQLRTTYDDVEFRTYAERLAAMAPTGSTIAVIDAGLIPYLTRWPAIDRWGLCDVHIAHSTPKGPLGEKFDEAYVLSRKPTFIQTKVTVLAEEKGLGGWAGDAELFSLPEFRRDYVRVPDRRLDGFFVRKDALPSLVLAP